MQATEPNPTWDATAHGETVDALSDVADSATVRVWGADWCGDCRAELPDLFAALDAAGVEDVRVYEVDREKRGELVDEYGVTRIPTVVVERDGEELARFEESAHFPAARSLAAQLD